MFTRMRLGCPANTLTLWELHQAVIEYAVSVMGSDQDSVNLFAQRVEIRHLVETVFKLPSLEDVPVNERNAEWVLDFVDLSDIERAGWEKVLAAPDMSGKVKPANYDAASGMYTP